VTGLGLVTSLGNDLASTERALLAGASAVAEETPFAPEARVARVRGLDARPHFRFPKAMKLTDERTRLAIAAASAAWSDAGLTDGAVDAPRAGVLLGSSGSDMMAEDLVRALANDPELRAARDVPFFAERILGGLNPLWLLVNLPNMVSAHVATQLSLRGPNSTVMTDWSAGLQAVGEAARLVEAGEADVVVAGGAEIGTLPLVLASYRPTDLFAPWEGRPGPFVLGDGAAVVIVEERAHALARGASPIAEVEGAASSSTPEGTGAEALERAARAALADASAAPEDVGAAVATAAPSARFAGAARDAWARLFGRRAAEVTCASAASRVGFALGAAGSIDLVLLLHSLRSRPQASRALAASLGFLGQAAAVLVRAERNPA
jgi:3-oxoacyl-(acyl-carrier-protein) synthase